MGKSVESIVKEFVSEYVAEEEDNINDSIKRASKIMLDEINNMYHSFIEQFYSSYTTTSYIRHGTSKPGVGYGYALYRANRSRVSGTKHPVIHIDIAGSYMQESYEYHSADEVFDFVSDDIRFTAGGIVKGKYNADRKGQPWQFTMGWHGSYYGRYFDFDCSIEEAFDSLVTNWDKYAMYVFSDVYKGGR